MFFSGEFSAVLAVSMTAHSDVIRLDQPVLCQGASKNKSPMKPHLHERTFNRDAILSALNEGIKPSCSRRSTASGLRK